MAPRRLLSIRFREGFFLSFSHFYAELGFGGYRITVQWALDKRNIKMEGEVLEKWQKVRVECSHFTLVCFDRTASG